LKQQRQGKPERRKINNKNKRRTRVIDSRPSLVLE
jgi:hypothetical protein